MAGSLSHKTPTECLGIPGCACYAPEALDTIAREMVEYRKCQVALDEKEKLIETRFVTFEANHGIAWWQEPTTIVGGLVVSASVATLATFWLVRGK